LTEIKDIENIFFKVLQDLEEYLVDLTLVGGWMPYVYSKFLWGDITANLITTTDIDFGINISNGTKTHSKNIFELLSGLDYKERHLQMDRLYPVVLYKEGKVRLDFIASREVDSVMIERFLGRQIDINKVDKFEFLMDNRIVVEVKNKNNIYKVNCPKPSAFLYHKSATFLDRDDEYKMAKDLFYMYFILRYCPDIETVLKEVECYRENNYFKEITKNIHEYFAMPTSKGCLLVERENGPDYFVENLRQDIFNRFRMLRSVVSSG
jgi:hypothetical protein